MVRPPSFDSNGMKKGAWSEEEDNKLRAYVTRYGHWNWRLLPKYAGLSRCGKSCRLRWVNYLKPGVKRGSFTKEEADLVIKLHAQLGNKWSAIAAKLPGRTDNEIKNFYHTRIEKRHTRNPAPNKAIRQTSEASPTDQVMEREKSFEITICETTDQNESDSSDIHDATSLINPQQSEPSLFDTNNASLLPIEQSQVDLWADKFLEGTNYSQNQSFPPLMEEAEFYHPQLQYSELSTSDSSYISGLDWINAEDDHSIISSEYVDPSVHVSFWGESSASNSSSNSQSSYAPAHEEVGGFYDPLIHYFDYGMNLFS